MNSVGHSVLFQVALDQMTPTARETVTKLLTEHTSNPEEGGFVVPAMDNYLPTQAAYPDQWKFGVKHKDHAEGEGDLHFDNRPVGPNAAAQDDDDAHGGAAHLVQQRNIAADPNASPDLRANALRWVVHEMGDVGAQPMHVVNNYSAEFPKGDEGGNLVRLTWGGDGKWDNNLHSLLDGGGAHADPSDPSRAIDNYDETIHTLPLDAAGTSFIQNKAHDIESRFAWKLNDPKVLDQDPNHWANELKGEAVDQVYPLFANGEAVKPDDSRLTKMETLMDSNVGLAGARLAAWANSTFDPASQT